MADDDKGAITKTIEEEAAKEAAKREAEKQAEQAKQDAIDEKKRIKEDKKQGMISFK